MAKEFNRHRSFRFWVLILPVIGIFYMALFLTMAIWYPRGLEMNEWRAHVQNFTLIYLGWLIVFYINRVFDWQSLRRLGALFAKLISSLAVCLLVAVVYFYFQPSLLLTPRRFLLANVVIAGIALMLWYMFVQRVFPFAWRTPVYSYGIGEYTSELQRLLAENPFAGLEYHGVLDQENLKSINDSIIVFPSKSYVDNAALGVLFSLRQQKVRFYEYHQLYESLTGKVNLSALTDMWFINSINYSKSELYQLIKRLLDVICAGMALVFLALTWPVIAGLIKITSPGPIFFKQYRVGLNGEKFALWKYRTMDSSSASNTWTKTDDVRITKIGKFLRLLRLDELPQAWNILKGDMSIVGPRPEQVNIVEQLRQQIPYYEERHIVKPGLTGWAQLHMYAGTVEETKIKLQYDLFYIKHRGLMFDIEIIIKTVYNIITFAGR
jgi:exopolysaccharide biosynthesis polyprenyl glycosylphosphotransferase